MRKKGLKLCSVLLSTSMAMTGVPTVAMPVFAAETEVQDVAEPLDDAEETEETTDVAENESEAEADAAENETEVVETQSTEGEQVIEDDFGGDALDSAWINSAGSVTWSQGKLNLTNNGGTVSTIQRQLGTGAYESEIHWDNYSADTSGNNSVMIFRVSDGSDQNLAEIQRFSNGQLHLLVINQGKQQDFTTTKDFTATEGWFKLTYDSTKKTIKAEYKTGDGEYQEMTGSGASMSNYGRKHVAEIRAQKWGGSKALSVDITNFNAKATFVNAANLTLKSDNMNVVVDEETGGIFQLSDPQDSYGTNYVMNPDIKPAFDIDDSRWVGDMKFTFSKNGSKSYSAVTSLSDDIREVSGDGKSVTVSYEGESENQYGLKDIDLTESYVLSDDGKKLNWNIHLKNTSGETLEVRC